MTIPRLHAFSAALVFVGLFAASDSDAAIISTYDHSGNGFASGTGADTFADENAGNSSYGAAGEVQMRNESGLRFQMPYYRFDLSAIDKASAQSAKLQVYDYRFGGLGQLDGQSIQVWALGNEALDDWGENSLTWNNAPGRTDNAIAFDGPDLNSDASFLGMFTFTRAGTTPWSVPFEVPGLVNHIRGDTNDQLTLMFVGPSGATLFRTGSKESSQVSLWTTDPILPGTAATRLHVETNTTIISTFDHNGDGFASGNGADTWISENAKNSNYGAVGNFRFRNQPSGQQEVGYLQFDISAFNATPVEAHLQLYDYRFSEGNLLHGRTLSIWGLRDGSLDNWDEMGITWNNAPGRTDNEIAFDGPDFNDDVVFLGDVTFQSEDPSHGWGIPLDVPGFAEFVAADTNGLITLMITGPPGVGTLFYAGSKESVSDRRINDPVAIAPGTIAPRLLLTVPEPGSSLLLLSALAGVLLVWRRRRS
ncbi:MAG: DNRLRE domain-containing protein [Thermoguttaceae bacterium]|jgi:hypothetical protein|nr:DNRLRE domain-containing protein [Thermoguttaceae bacterium]